MSNTPMIWGEVSVDTLLAWMRCEIVTLHYSIPQTCVHNRTLERVRRMSEVKYVERTRSDCLRICFCKPDDNMLLFL